VHEEEGIHILTRRQVPITIKISKTKDKINNISFCVEDMVPGRKMRVHKHLYNDELIFIHKGEGTLTLDEQLVEVKTGTAAFVPRGTWHGLDNTGIENLSMVFQYSPAGFEEYFVENGMPVEAPANRVRQPGPLRGSARRKLANRCSWTSVSPSATPARSP
jgi:mannose-6-phosphate isomerase-like protein (cupin superfamily)